MILYGFTAVGVLLVIGGVYLLNKGTDEIEGGSCPAAIDWRYVCSSQGGSIWRWAYSNGTSSCVL